MERRLYRGITTPAMIATWIFGLWMVFAGIVDWSMGLALGQGRDGHRCCPASTASTAACCATSPTTSNTRPAKFFRHDQRDPVRHRHRHRHRGDREAVLAAAFHVNRRDSALNVSLRTATSTPFAPHPGQSVDSPSAARGEPPPHPTPVRRPRSPSMENMKLSELKAKSPAELLVFAEEHEVENASTMRKQELMFAILKELAASEVEITGEGVVEVLPDGFGFLRSPDANYLPGPDDIYVSPSQIRRFSLRTGDTVEGEIRLSQGRRALLCAAQGLDHQFRGPREGPPQDQLRQPDPALSRRAPAARAAGPDGQGQVAPASWTSWRRSAKASAPSSLRRRVPVRPYCCRISHSRSRPITPSATSSCC